MHHLLIPENCGSPQNRAGKHCEEVLSSLVLRPSPLLFNADTQAAREALEADRPDHGTELPGHEGPNVRAHSITTKLCKLGQVTATRVMQVNV